MGLLNKIYGLIQAERCLFNLFCDDKFGQSEADRRVFRKFKDGEVVMVVLVHVDDILAHVQATMELFVADLGERFKVKTMGETFGVEKTNRIPALSGVLTLSPSG